jgi:hypothetical protein
MSHAPGTTAADAGEKLKGDPVKRVQPYRLAGDVTYQAFNSEDFAFGVGRMMAADQFLGNYDRVSAVLPAGGAFQAPKTHAEKPASVRAAPTPDRRRSEPSRPPHLALCLLIAHDPPFQRRHRPNA